MCVDPLIYPPPTVESGSAVPLEPLSTRSRPLRLAAPRPEGHLLARAPPGTVRHDRRERAAGLPARGAGTAARRPWTSIPPSWPRTSPIRASWRPLARTEILVTGWGCPRLDAAVLDAAPALRAVLHSAGSVKGFATPELWRRGIAVSSAAEANALPVAEYTLAMILLAGKDILAAPRPDAPAARVHPGWGVVPGIGNHGRRVGRHRRLPDRPPRHRTAAPLRPARRASPTRTSTRPAAAGARRTAAAAWTSCCAPPRSSPCTPPRPPRPGT